MASDVFNGAVLWLGRGRQYFDAVEAINSKKNYGELAPMAPMFQLAGTGLEIVFKAELLRSGATEETLKDCYGHDIKKLHAAMCETLLKQSETKARSVYKAQLRGLRDKHRESFGDFADAIDALSEFPTNADIGDSWQSIAAIINGLYVDYGKNDSFRYARKTYFQVKRLKFPPYIDLTAFYICAFGRAFADQIERRIRSKLQECKC